MDALDELEQILRDATELGIDYDPSAFGPQKQRSPVLKHYPATKTYLFLLRTPFDTRERLQRLAQVSKVIEQVEVEDDSGAIFYIMNGTLRSKIEQKLPLDFRPTWTTRNIASKDLSSFSMARFLGRDYTLPQYRPEKYMPPHPAMGQFPV